MVVADAPTGILAGNPAIAPRSSNEIVFIDGAVSNAQLLAAGVKPGVEAVILDPGQDGVRQIAAYLTSHGTQDLAAIGIVSHGADGVLFLGSAVLDSSTMNQYGSELTQIGAALQSGGGLLLYGCDVAQDAAGVAFIDQLSAATGGASIAAASHLVGAASQGGSFALDVNVGQVAAPSPFTAAAQANFAGVLPTAINQLYFAVSNITPTNTVNRVNRIGVSGATTIGTATDLIDGSQATFGNGTTVISLPGVAVDPALGKFFFTDTNSNATFNKIYTGNLASPGTVTAIVSTPTNTTQLQGLAIDQPNGNLYYALNNSSSAGIGIYMVPEIGGTATQVVGGFTVASHLLFQIALDVPDNLVFFADSPGISAVSTLWAGNLISHTETALATSAKGARLEGVAYNNGTIYWSTFNGSTIANNNIYSAPVSISGSGSLTTASLGTTSTLYAGAATGNGTIANTPISLAVDPSSGILYSGSNIVTAGTYQAIVNAGTVTGGSSMTTIFSSPFAGTAASGAPLLALTLETTPTVTASGTASYVIGGAAVAADATASVSNPSGFNLASATVAITGGTFVGDGDTLTATVTGTSITASFSGETLTLNGNDTLSHYQQVLDSVRFSSTATDPKNGGANPNRTVSWTVSDGVITSSTPTSLIDLRVTPTIAVSGTIAYGNSAGPVALDPAATIVAPDSGGVLSSATIAVTGGAFPSDGDVLAATTAGTSIVANYDSATGTLTLTGSDTITHYQAVLRSATIDTSGVDPTNGGANPNRTQSWVVNDGVAASSAATTTANGTLCFCAGTLILTPSGEVPVEHLSVGDKVITAFGATRTIQWLGTGKVLATRGRRNEATPIIVRKAAFGDNIPHKDLRVTKGHAFQFGDVLIPAEYLVNHRSILWDDHAQEVHLFHIELISHDVLVANGAPAESYRDDGNRWLFQNANSGWDQPPKPPCAPVLTGGPIVDAVWRQLLARSGPRTGFPMTDNPDIHILLDGQRIDAATRIDDVLMFQLPSGRGDIRLASRSAAPQELGMARDPRCLGVAVSLLVAMQNHRMTAMEAADDRLANGFHDYEPDNCFRWTDGHASIPLSLFAAFAGPVKLLVTIASTAHYIDDSPAAAA